MLRLVIENILLFLAPAAMYVAYDILVRRSGQTPRQVMDDAPLIALFLAGIALFGLTLLVFGARGTMEEGRAGQAYEPPVYKDGKITPGRVK